MLLELRVKDLGIIEELAWQLSEGLNVITGETGAGKSLVIDAVELLLSGKADAGMVRHGAEEALAEGVFDLTRCPNAPAIKETLAEKCLIEDDPVLAVSCRLRRSGQSVIRLNTHAVPKALLQKVGALLIDVHGQSEHLSLLRKESHLDYLDAYAHALELRREFAADVTLVRKAEAELASLTRDEQAQLQRQEFLRFQIDEIRQAGLNETEEGELEQERRLLSSVTKVKECCHQAYQALYEADDAAAGTALERLNEAIQAVRKLAELDTSLAGHLKYLEEAAGGLAETARDIHVYGDRRQLSPERIEEVESRLDLIHKLKRKYGPAVKDVFEFKAKAEQELDASCGARERGAKLQQTVIRVKGKLAQTARRLSELRETGAARLALAVKEELEDLGITGVKFEVAVSRQPSPEGLPYPDGKSYVFGPDGADSVEFVVSTNPGEPLRPLAKIASTGEMSRFTLALKSALSEADQTPVLVFDEIELGIGGRSGEVIGQKLWRLARRHQVICVTHLPQIAAFADAHFRVRKVTSGERAASVLERLDGPARAAELSDMLAGPARGEASLKNAKEFLEKAQTWKSKDALDSA